MTRARSLAFAAAVAAGVIGLSSQAMAAYVRLGSVDVGFHTDRSSTWDRFGGRMEGLRLKADHSDIFCRSIVVHYGNGQRDEVFSGHLREDRPVNVDLAGRSRRVRRIDFVCRSRERRGGRILVMADVGRYRDEWRRSPGWHDRWSRVFNWGPGPGAGPAPIQPTHEWVVMSREHFEGRRDRERSSGGWASRHVDRIGLMALNDDARCARVRVVFDNGERQRLRTGDRGVLRRGRLYSFDLRGRKRNIRHVNLVCRAMSGYRVTIEVLTRK